jgi:hypothetical protein
VHNNFFLQRVVNKWNALPQAAITDGMGIAGTVQFAPSFFDRGPICPETYPICPVVICPRVRVRVRGGVRVRVWGLGLALGLGLGLEANRVGLQECGQIGPEANSTTGK